MSRMRSIIDLRAVWSVWVGGSGHPPEEEPGRDEEIVEASFSDFDIPLPSRLYTALAISVRSSIRRTRKFPLLRNCSVDNLGFRPNSVRAIRSTVSANL